MTDTPASEPDTTPRDGDGQRATDGEPQAAPGSSADDGQQSLFGDAAEPTTDAAEPTADAPKPAARRTTRRKTTRRTAAKSTTAKSTAVKRTTRRQSAKAKAPAPSAEAAPTGDEAATEAPAPAETKPAARRRTTRAKTAGSTASARKPRTRTTRTTRTTTTSTKAKAQAEQEAKEGAEELAKAQAEEEAKEGAEELAKAQAEQEAKKKAEAEKKAEAKAQAEQEAKKKAEAEKKAEAKAQAEAEAKKKAEAEAEAKKKAEAEKKAEAKAQAEAEAKKKAEELAKAEAEAKVQAEQEAKEKAEEQAKAETAPGGGVEPGDRPTTKRLLLDRTAHVPEALDAAFSGIVGFAVDAARRVEVDPVTAVHEFRKATRRARSLVKLMEPLLPEETAEHLGRALKKAVKPTSRLRDDDVLLPLLDELGRDARLGPVVSDVRAVLEDAMARSREGVSPPTVLSRAVERLNPLTSGVGLPTQAKKAVRKRWREFRRASLNDLVRGLAESYRQARRGTKRAAEDRRVGDVHAWRLRLKELRYQLELFEGVAPLDAFRAQVAQLAQDLGAVTDHMNLHDRVVMAAPDLPEPRAAEPLVETILARTVALLDAALDRARVVFARRSKDFRKDARAALEQASASAAGDDETHEEDEA